MDATSATVVRGLRMQIRVMISPSSSVGVTSARPSARLRALQSR